MIDDPPCIIIDNQKIAPLQRVSRLNSASPKKPIGDDWPFGVVDRVTISREAMEKLRRQQARTEADPSEGWPLTEKPKTTTIPLLTDSPNPRR